MAAIGELLVQEGIITMQQLGEALTHQRANGGRLGDTLVSLGFITDSELKQFFNTVPPVPMKAERTGLSVHFLIDLVLKVAYSEGGTFSLGSMSKSLHLTVNIVDELAEIARIEGYVAIRSAAGYSRTTHVFELTSHGHQRVEDALNQCRYIGPAPVPLKVYSIMTAHQTVRQIEIDAPWLRKALSHLVVDDDLLDQLGPAFNSGRSIFLYGPPGTGKSSIAEALARAIESHVYIPYAVEVDGQVIRLFDPSVHVSVEGTENEACLADMESGHRHDRRWHCCRRPVVIVGGELTLNALDLDYDPVAKYYEAPIHMKAANGVFILDDFGRQAIEPRQLLNRWIVPLERGTDFLSLNTGKKFAIPFDQITLFCTNLKPSELVDEALLRRIRHKIRINYETEPQYLEILRRVCLHEGIPWEEAATEYLIETYYRRASRPLAGCHPRDLVEQIIDRARFLSVKPELTPATIHAAAANYFVRHE
jgi:DNA polymerase III delta prime subunit